MIYRACVFADNQPTEIDITIADIDSVMGIGNASWPEEYALIITSLPYLGEDSASAVRLCFMLMARFCVCVSQAHW